MLLDGVCVSQTERLRLSDWEMLTNRASGRAGNIPHPFVIGDANPDHPRHWIKLRQKAGSLRLINSRHIDNPSVYNPVSGELTPSGKTRMDVLKRLTGVRRKRLFLGEWAQSEGTVYPEFDWDVHVVKRETVDLDAIRRWVVGVDWGYTNPGVMALWGIDGDGRMIRVQEVYHTQKLIPWWIGIALEMQAEFRIEAFVCDPSRPEYITQLKNAGIPAVAANNDIELGIQAVAGRLPVQEDGLPRLRFLEDGLLFPDEMLIAAEKPSCTEMEFDGYVWPKSRIGRTPGEKPVGEDDHGMDEMRYVAMYADGLSPRPDEEDDEVWAA